MRGKGYGWISFGESKIIECHAFEHRLKTSLDIEHESEITSRQFFSGCDRPGKMKQISLVSQVTSASADGRTSSNLVKGPV